MSVDFTTAPRSARPARCPTCRPRWAERAAGSALALSPEPMTLAEFSSRRSSTSNRYTELMLGELLIAVMLAAAQNALDSGQQALQAGDLTRAEQLFRQYLSQNPGSAEALSDLGAVCARRQQFSEAVAFYGKALKANPKLVPVHFNMAIALGQLKAYDKAAQHLRIFLKPNPKEARARQLLGLSLLELGDLRGALAELETSYKLNPKDGSILYTLALANVRAGDADRAVELLRQTQTDPAQSKLIEALIEYRRGRFSAQRRQLLFSLSAAQNGKEAQTLARFLFGFRRLAAQHSAHLLVCRFAFCYGFEHAVWPSPLQLRFGRVQECLGDTIDAAGMSEDD